MKRKYQPNTGETKRLNSWSTRTYKYESSLCLAKCSCANINNEVDVGEAERI